MQKISSVILWISAIASLGMVLNAGRHAHVILIILFAGWVFSPFLALFIIKNVDKFRLQVTPDMFQWLVITISLGSLLIYGMTLIRQNTKTPTATYLLVPLISWIIIISFMVVTAFNKRRS